MPIVGESKTAPSPLASFWRILVRIEKGKAVPWLALRHTIGTTLPLAVGAATGHISGALPITTGALNVGFTDGYEPYPTRAKRMFGASLLVGAGVFLGAISGGHHILAVALATGWAFAAGILVSLSPVAADLGIISFVTFVVFSATPLPPEKAAYAGLLAFAGGLMQMSIALFFWPLRRHGPERRVLGDLFLEISRTAAAPAQGSIDSSQAPPASAQITLARTMLAPLDRGGTLEGERYQILLSQAERMRLCLVTLRRVRSRMRRECPECAEARNLDRFFQVCSPMIAAIGNSLVAGNPARGFSEGLLELQGLAGAFREVDERRSPTMGVMVADARIQLDAIAGQLRTAFDLAGSATPEGADAFARRESRQPWRLRLQGTFAILRANLSLNSAACRHAIRLAVSIAIGDSFGRGFGLERSYWLPMTIAIVLKPDFTATFSRGVLRLLGTFAGLLLATGLFHVVPHSVSLQIVLVAISMYVLRCFGPANYGILVTAVTALVVLLFALLGYPPKEVMAARALNTVAAGVIALVAYGLWPTWERTQVPELVAQLLDAYRLYFRAVREHYLTPDASSTHELDRVRLSSRLARSNLEASIERLLSEPGASATTTKSLGAILASSHRLAHALMALEAGFTTNHPAPPREAFRPLANHIELTLYYQGAVLRGSGLPLEDFPELREDHYKLVHSGDALTQIYALVNVETDRITNSLNTMTGEIYRWKASGWGKNLNLSTTPKSCR